MASVLRVLGIDPGLADLGWGIVEQQGARLFHIAHGCLQTSPDQDLASRLKILYDGLFQVAGQYEITAASVEELYFAANSSSALPVAHARGVALLACAQRGIVVRSFSPKTIKQAVLGSGAASKAQVQGMVKLLLSLSAIPKPDHAADALAAAICYINNQGIGTLSLGGSGRV